MQHRIDNQSSELKFLPFVEVEAVEVEVGMVVTLRL
jgi:hypothetical protein